MWVMTFINLNIVNGMVIEVGNMVFAADTGHRSTFREALNNPYTSLIPALLTKVYNTTLLGKALMIFAGAAIGAGLP